MQLAVSSDDASVVYSLHYEDLFGTLRQTSAGFVIVPGTEVSTSEVDCLKASAKRERKKLRQSGVIVEHPTFKARWVMARAHTARSLSEAALIVTGSTKSARRVWRPLDTTISAITRH